ncbi:lytic polysaccharide monooxygenase [Francisella philomiragia]|uniref:lytic polysaccharide monooxygenase n=1 Tax=Francisella philomiragia TaxID=28110 RepID=UPI00190300F4|nr:lytic polysaccharide monooxygenase [Francisella philomiragia]MBK2297159.1 lytic polysaccharide monooxygenase [Francisella philomiragia]MBK2341405.1 lytic polysaccharide monooxygenase [Francisella philomiragia]
MKKKLLLSALTLSAITPTLTFAHGALSYPESRQMYCTGSSHWEPKDPVCKAILEQDKAKAWTDWSGNAQGDANGRVTDPSKESYLINKHKAAISSKSGVCGGGNSSPYDVLDDTSIDWSSHATTINIKDQKDFVYEVTAPHKTNFDVDSGLGYLDLYITNNNWKPSSKVTKDDLVHLCMYQPDSSGVSPMQTGTDTLTGADNKNEKFKCKIPDTVSNGEHVIFAIWQRSDSAEAFYSCSDVDIINATPAEITWNKSKEMLSYVVKPNDTIEFSATEGNRDIGKSVIITDKNQNDWQYELAQKINSSSDAIQAGLLNKTTNKVEPQHNNFNNAIYINSAVGNVNNINFKHIEAPQPEPEHYEYKPVNRTNHASNSLYDISSLKAGDKIVFRLFNNKLNLLTNTSSGNTDIDKIALRITDKNIRKWKFALANKFNKNSSVKDKIIIGVLNNDEVKPVNKPTANNAVYILDSKKESGDNYSWTIDIRSSEDPQPEPEPTPSDNYTYPEGIGSYELGTIVISDNKEFKCKVPSWCNIEAYKPLGIYSSAAWEDMSEQPEPGPTPEGTWNKNDVYTEQDKPVTLEGITYKANYWTQGDDPRKNNCQYGCPWTKV